MGEDSAKRFRDGLRLISSVVHALSAAEAVELPAIVARMIATAIPDLCVVILMTDDGTYVPAGVHDGDPAAVAAFSAIRIAPGEPTLSAEALAGGPLLFGELDLGKLRERLPASAIAPLVAIGARGMVVAPLAIRGESLGALGVIRRRPEHPPLDELDLEIVENLAHHVALALSNARLVARLQHSEALRAADERALEASRLLDAIVENIPDMIFVKDADRLAFVRFNRAGEELLGVSRDELIGKNDFDLFPKDEAEFFVAKDRETLAAQALVEIPEEPIQTRNGPRWLHTKKVPLVDADGTPRYLLGISHDITERRRAVEELREAKEAAETANRELESFSYSVAHDLRAPLRAIDGFSQALLEDLGDKLEPGPRHHLGRVRDAAQRMAMLIDDLLALSRVTRADLQRERVDLSAIAAGIVAELQRAEPERRVEVAIQPGLVVEADRRMMAIALTNLFSNAWKFTSKSTAPRIELGAGKEGFWVRDNGAGFDMKYADKLFGVFQRLHTDAEFTGTGIGLVTVARILRRHRGRVWAEGVTGHGATFYFTLPR